MDEKITSTNNSDNLSKENYINTQKVLSNMNANINNEYKERRIYEYKIAY